MTDQNDRLPLEFRDKMWKFLQKYDWNYAISLAFNADDVTISSAEGKLDHFMAKMDRAALGPRWHKKPDERIFAFYFLEKPKTNLHWHGVMVLPAAQAMRLSKRVDLLMRIDRIWTDTIPSGSTKVKLIFDEPGWLNYIAKCVRNPLESEAFRPYTGIR